MIFQKKVAQNIPTKIEEFFFQKNQSNFKEFFANTDCICNQVIEQNALLYSFIVWEPSKHLAKDVMDIFCVGFNHQCEVT